MAFFKSAGNIKKQKEQLNDMPEHIAIIMDGNGRWAKKRGLMRKLGHAAGGEALKRLAYHCDSIGVKYLTVYAFSTENWKRPSDEILAIMSLLKNYLLEAIEKMRIDNIAVRIIGDKTGLSKDILDLIDKSEKIADSVKDGLTVNICLNYGARDEILKAVKKIASDIYNGFFKPEEIDENMFSGYLYTKSIPDPDLIIRTSGEIRISNFLLWQSAYSEFYFTDVLWPDFDETELDKAIMSYKSRSRRYGGV